MPHSDCLLRVSCAIVCVCPHLYLCASFCLALISCSGTHVRFELPISRHRLIACGLGAALRLRGMSYNAPSFHQCHCVCSCDNDALNKVWNLTDIFVNDNVKSCFLTSNYFSVDSACTLRLVVV